MVSKYDLLFEQWKATLKDKDRRTAAIQGNFEELFESLRENGLVLESAYEYLPKAIKAHSPAVSLVKTMYKKLKHGPKFEYASEKDFEESWINDIADKANQAFFNIFPIQTKKNDEEDEPVIYGSMTAKEYKAQRKHADEYPRFNTEELEHRLSEVYDPTKDLDLLLGKKSGDSK